MINQLDATITVY